MYRHIVQSQVWSDIKNEYGTRSVKAGNLYYTLHKLPRLNKFIAYCPRVLPEDINRDLLISSLKENNCIGINFDVPNVLQDSPEYEKAVEYMNGFSKKINRNEFAPANVILDLNKPLSELFKNLHKKHRYNTKLASRNGVEIKLAETENDFDVFYSLFKETSLRENFFIRPKDYYQLIWKRLKEKGSCDILTAYHEGIPLVSWMLFMYDDVLYYPYGGSSLEKRNLFASNAIGWEAIRYGHERGAKVFDMWGAALDPDDGSDPYHGFTNFKLKFGANHVKYMSSYALRINPMLYEGFSLANDIRWQLLDLGIIK